MTNFSSADEILKFAIQNEQDAVDLYTDLAQKAQSPAIKETFSQYAEEERGHKAKLERVRSGKKVMATNEKILDLKISDYTVGEKLGENPDYQSVLIFAMKAEKAAFKLYTELAARTGELEFEELFLGLAQEEAKHKLRFEIEYDDNILLEN
jgi:rubrerythrin